MASKIILSDIGDIIFKGVAYTKEGFYEFVKDKIQQPEDQAAKKEKILKTYIKYRDQAFVDKDYSYWQACQDALKELGLDHYYPAFLEYNNQKEGITILPQVKETLDAWLRKGNQFYGVSDSVFGGSYIEQLLRSYRIKIKVISSKDVGAIKPDKKFFDKALKLLGLESEEFIFLGHSYDELKGAHDLGFKVVAVNYDENDDLIFIPEEYRLKEFPNLLNLDLQAEPVLDQVRSST